MCVCITLHSCMCRFTARLYLYVCDLFYMCVHAACVNTNIKYAGVMLWMGVKPLTKALLLVSLGLSPSSARPHKHAHTQC